MSLAVATHSSKSSAVRLPNFVIAGAPKCGTTALYEYLRTHPSIFLPMPKEPQFFADDVGRHREVTRRQDYERLYAAAGPRHLAIGDASPWYMHSAVAMQRLSEELTRDLKIIIALRSPVEFVASLHSDLVWVCFENETDLARAWELQTARQQGEHIPGACLVPWFLQYRQLARFSPYVERVLRLYPREQLKVILLDDMKQSPAAVYGEVLDFLGVAPDGRSEFKQVNPASANRWPSLARWQSSLQYALPDWALRLGKGLGLGRINRSMKRLNTARRSRSAMLEELRQRMLAELMDDINRLEGLLDRDLSAWKR